MSTSKFSLVWPSTAGARDEQLEVAGHNSFHFRSVLLHECINVELLFLLRVHVCCTCSKLSIALIHIVNCGCSATSAVVACVL